MPTQNHMYARCSAYFSQRHHFAIQGVVLVSFSVIVEENSMKLLQYYVINKTSIWRLYKEINVWYFCVFY